MTTADLEDVTTRSVQLRETTNSDLKGILSKVTESIPDPESPSWKWHTDYMKSVTAQFNDRKRTSGLSPKQLYFVAKIEKQIELFPNANASQAKFAKEYVENQQMQSDMKIVMEYYEKTGYYTTLVQDYYKNKDNKEWAPTQLVYERAVINNKYVQRLLTTIKTPDKYAAGQFVTLRSSISYRSRTEKIESPTRPDLMISRVYKTGDLLMVLNYEPSETEPKKGGKSVKLLAVGTQDVFSLFECNIKKVKVK